MTHRFTIDYEADYELIRAVFDELYPSDPFFGVEAILALLHRRPELYAINAHLAGVNWYRHHLHELKTVDAQLRNSRKELGELKKHLSTAMVMADNPKARDTFVLMRGQYDQKGEKVTAGVPAFLPPLVTLGEPTRLDFARWLVEPEHPLTARVIVNRAWQLYFGSGLVKTVEDFAEAGAWWDVGVFFDGWGAWLWFGWAAGDEWGVALGVEVLSERGLFGGRG